jgi:predicted DsbA family dithiol-disulfide isomerase
MTRSEPVLLYFDYVDPASFLLERRIRALADPDDPPVTPTPFEVRPPPLPLLDPLRGPWGERWEAMRGEAEARGVKLRRPPIVPWTRKAHELAFHARERGVFQEVHEALFRAFLQEGRDIGRVDVLADLGADAGLDRTETKAVLDVDRYADRVLARRREAEEARITLVPTLARRDQVLEGYPEEEILLTFLTRYDEPD